MAWVAGNGQGQAPFRPNPANLANPTPARMRAAAPCRLKRARVTLPRAHARRGAGGDGGDAGGLGGVIGHVLGAEAELRDWEGMRGGEGGVLGVEGSVRSNKGGQTCQNKARLAEVTSFRRWAAVLVKSRVC